MKVRQHHEARGIVSSDLQLDLSLHRNVINRGAAIGDVEFRRGIEIEEVRPLQIAADKRKPVDHPEKQGSDTGAGGRGVAKPNQALGQPWIHRPLSRRRANRSGSLAFRIARCAPLMS